METRDGRLRYYVQNRGDEVSNRLTGTFHELAQTFGLIEDRENPEVVVSIGGDGTMLHAFHLFLHALDRVSFVGIHTGHLGFFADWQTDELEQLVEAMAKQKLGQDARVVRYPLVEVELTLPDSNRKYYALNEITIKGEEGTLVSQVHINNELFEMFRGDGICISTPSGSTAYNKSLGGAVIHPSLESIQIAEIASINNRVYRTLGSSVILPKHHHCDIIPRAGQRLQLSIDHLSEEWTNIVNIRCRVAEQKVSFARYRPFPFWTRVREAFIHNGDNS